MIRDITIGQYYPAPSVIHRLDPRVKLVGTLVFIIMIFCINNLAGYVAATAALACLVNIEGALKIYFKGPEGHIFYFNFHCCAQLIFDPGNACV